jgi:PAS domain S-box-containing protein
MGKSTMMGRRVAGRDRLGGQLLLGIILASSVVTLATTGVQLYRDYQGDLQRIESSLQLIETSYLSTLVNSLWNFDDAQTRIMLRGMASLPDMELLEVTTPDGAVHREGSRRSGRTVEREFTLVYRSEAGESEVGRMLVVASVDRVLGRLVDRFMFILASNAVKTFLVAAFALALFHLLVTRHLHRIALHADELDLEQDTPRLLRLDRRYPQDAPPDSLERLVEALNRMARRLASERQRIDESERRYRDLVDGSLQGVLVNDGRRIVYANRSAARILGYETAQEVCDLELETGTIAPEDRQRLSGYRTARLAGGTAPERYEAVWLRRDGSRIVIDNIVRKVDWFGTEGIQSTFVDITARKEAEEQLRRHQGRLEELVAQRTAELEAAQQELVRSERLSTIGQMTADPGETTAGVP